MKFCARRLAVVIVGAIVLGTCGVTSGQSPDHPIITEIYTDPPGLNDGPVGRDPASLHQEFIEIYLPAANELSVALAPHAEFFELTFYEVEGDSSSSGRGLVNYRFDLPPLDLNISNGVTPGAIGRPTTGVVVLGWLDYADNPPTALAGTPTTRVALVDGGVTTLPGPPNDYVFLAINGHQFGSVTSNVDVVQAENLIDLPAEASSGIVQNGSGAYLLVHRASVGYVELCDDQHAGDCAAGADPTLPSDATSLKTGALLDGCAANDDSNFDVTLQPYSIPTGLDIDLETELPAGGAFSLLVPQIPETVLDGANPGVANGYARVFVDVPKTTETVATDNPAQDATTAYRHVRNDGPFIPTPGRVVFTTSPPDLGMASTQPVIFLLAQTTAPMGILSANVGGNTPIDIVATPGASSDPSVATFALGQAATNVAGQSFAFPTVSATAPASAPDGSVAQTTVSVSATESVGGAPVGSNPTATAAVAVLNPTTGRDASGLPFQTTVFVAIQGIVDQPGVDNEFLNTDLGAFLAAQPDITQFESEGFGATLLNPLTNLTNGITVQGMVKTLPDPGEECTNWLAFAGPPGKLDLGHTVSQSAEVLSGSLNYDGSFVIDLDCGGGVFKSAVRAIRLNHPDIQTFGSGFTPSETLHFADFAGAIGDPFSDLTNVTTTRTFELVLVETNVRANGTVETGATDDFGLIVQVRDVEPASSVVPGEFVFLSFTGGKQGADIDTLQVPPGDTIANLIFLDFDNLHSVLGIRSLEQIIVLDGGGSSEIDVMEAFALSPLVSCINSAQCDDGLFCNGSEICDAFGTCQSGAAPCTNPGLPVCDEGADLCRECLNAGHCDDGNDCTTDSCVLFTCTHSNAADGTACAGGVGTCTNGQCSACVADSECDDGTVCTRDECIASACVYANNRYGDADGNGFITLFDLFCVLDGFGGDFSSCSFEQDDVQGSCGGGPNCCPNGVITLGDLFAVLDAFGGEDPCCGG